MSAQSRLTLKSLAFAALLATSACQQHDSGGTPGAYVENGVLWAYGSVQLSKMEVPGAIMLKRTAPVQNVDTPPFALYGAIQAVTEGGVSGERDVAYVDWHPVHGRLLAYAWQVDYAPRPGYGDLIDVFAVLKKPGRSYFGRQKVYLGAARFEKNAAIAPLTLAPDLRLSLIADGVFSGQWALHYADAPMIVTRPWAGICPKGVAQMPGQNPSQNPGQYDQCRPIPAQVDLCEGNPMKDGCRPKPPVQQIPTSGVDAPLPPATQAGELEMVDAATRVYALPADVKEAKLVFVSTTLAAASDEENAQLCAKRFYAVGRTVGRQVNAACVLKPAPASAQGGKLACGITVGFEQAQTYLEKVCDVTAVFQGGAGGPETQTVQVLKR